MTFVALTGIVPKIIALEPDLVLAFSDLQADIAAELVRAGVAIHVVNQRDVAGILACWPAQGLARINSPAIARSAWQTSRQPPVPRANPRSISRNGIIR